MPQAIQRDRSDDDEASDNVLHPLGDLHLLHHTELKLGEHGAPWALVEREQAFFRIVRDFMKNVSKCCRYIERFACSFCHI